MEKGVLIKSVSKSIAVLQTINLHGSMSITNIARYEKLPYPTAFRIVQTLMHEGLIEQEPLRKHYRPTALVDSLAHGYRAETRIADVAHDHMRAFTREMGWPLFVSVRVGTQMVVRASTHAETSLTFALCHPGVTVPLLTSATGHAMLASLNGPDLEATLQWSDPSFGSISKVEREQVQKIVTQVRADGYAAKPCSSSTRTSSIAVPIRRTLKGAEAVLTMTYFNAAMTQAAAIERYADHLKAIGEMIGRESATC